MVQTAEFPWRIVPVEPAGYEVHALIPLSELLLEPDVEQFLLECAVVAAVGSAKNGTFTLLYTVDPGPGAFQNNRQYALAVVEGEAGEE
jgi:hypothetical protein